MPYIEKDGKQIWIKEDDYLMSQTKEYLIEMIKDLKDMADQFEDNQRD